MECTYTGSQVYRYGSWPSAVSSGYKCLAVTGTDSGVSAVDVHRPDMSPQLRSTHNLCQVSLRASNIHTSCSSERLIPLKCLFNRPRRVDHAIIIAVWRASLIKVLYFRESHVLYIIYGHLALHISLSRRGLTWCTETVPRLRRMHGLPPPWRNPFSFCRRNGGPSFWMHSDTYTSSR